MKVTAKVEKGGAASYSCKVDGSVGKWVLVGYGKTADEAIDDLEASCREAYEDTGDETYLHLEKEYVFDVGSLFSHYGFLNIEGVARLAGIPSSVLRQYACGARSPRKDKTQKIEDAIRTISRQTQRVVLYA